MLASSDRVLFGAACYHEYQPYDRLDVDLDLMQEAHFASTGAAAVDGTRLRFLHDWSWDPASVSVPAEVHDMLTGEPFHTQDRVQLGPWDVRVLAVRQP